MRSEDDGGMVDNGCGSMVHVLVPVVGGDASAPPSDAAATSSADILVDFAILLAWLRAG